MRFLPLPDGPPRVAYAVGRRVGGAVVRNRLRRRLRHVVHDLAPELASGAYLVAATSAASALDAPSLRRLLGELLRDVTAEPT